jgi:hypothetical protein
MSHLFPRIILSTSEEACCGEKKSVCYTQPEKSQLLIRKILTCQWHVKAFSNKTNNLSFSTRRNSEKSLKMEEGKRSSFRACLEPGQTYPQGLTVILLPFFFLFLHEKRKKIKLMVI